MLENRAGSGETRREQQAGAARRAPRPHAFFGSAFGAAASQSSGTIAHPPTPGLVPTSYKNNSGRSDGHDGGGLGAPRCSEAALGLGQGRSVRLERGSWAAGPQGPCTCACVGPLHRSPHSECLLSRFRSEGESSHSVR